MKYLKSWWQDDSDLFFHIGLYLAAIIVMFIHEDFDHWHIICLSLGVASVFAVQALFYYRMGLRGVICKAPFFFSIFSLFMMALFTLIYEDLSELGFFLALFCGVVVLLIFTDWIRTAVSRFIFAIFPPWKKFQPTIEIDTRGVRMELKAGRPTIMFWEDLVEVGILTTDGGPLVEDFFYILISKDGDQMNVPDELARELLRWLQELPGFDNMAVIEAVGCTWNAAFLAWEGEPGDGALASPPPTDDVQIE